MFNLTYLDRKVIDKYGPNVVGVDEVGMGPIAGPVCACALVVDLGKADRISSTSIQVDDSKRLSRSDRQLLFPRIVAVSRYALGWTSVEEIATLNITEAGNQARLRALSNLMEDFKRSKRRVDAIISDWFEIKSSVPCVAQAKADRKSFIVACASIVAKVSRDEYMMEQHKRYPAYDWYNNVGYGVPNHLIGIKMNGTTPLHRMRYVTKIMKRREKKLSGWENL